MSDMNEILFLQDAIKAIAVERLKAETRLEHAETCSVCRSRVLSFFFKCNFKDEFELDHLVAQQDVDKVGHQLLRRQVDLEKRLTEVDSLEGLYNLRDDRTE